MHKGGAETVAGVTHSFTHSDMHARAHTHTCIHTGKTKWLSSEQKTIHETILTTKT